MELEKAILVLSNELARKDIKNCVYDSAIKQKLLETSRWTLLRDDKGRIFSEYNKIKADLLNLPNYFFQEVREKGTYSTDVALIGQAEEKALREIFYKEMPEEIEDAFSRLGIQSFRELFELYSKDETAFLEKVKSFEKGDLIQLGRDGKGIYTGNESFSLYGYKIAEKNPVTEQFLNFIFKMPEEQNEELNKKVLQELSELVDFTEVLYEKYGERYTERNANFLEYFNCTNERTRKKIIRRINLLDKTKQNNILNLELFKRGQEVYVKVLSMYETEPGYFRNFFSRTSDNERREILDTLFELPKEKINPDISKWLSENYAELVEDVGRAKVKIVEESEKKLQGDEK